MSSLTSPRARWGIAGMLVAAALLSGIGAIYPRNTWLQVGPVILVALLLPWAMQRWPLPRAAWGSVLAFLLLHLFAAHWTYSDVPYQSWLLTVGVDSAALIGSDRNMFDRLVHFAFGLLAVVPVIEVERRYAGVSPRLARRLSILFVLAASALYEIFEWLIAVTMSPEAAEAYNGQQGDMFDGQKDMTLATLGAVVTLMFLALRKERSEP